MAANVGQLSLAQEAGEMGSGIPRVEGGLGQAELCVGTLPDDLFDPLRSPLQGPGTRLVPKALTQFSGLAPDLSQRLMERIHGNVSTPPRFV
jgi:hypothetical protein